LVLLFYNPPLLRRVSGWQEVNATQGKLKLYLNSKSFKREGEVVNVAFRYVYGDTQTFPFLNKKFDRLERLFYFQCGERKLVVAKSEYYLGNEQVHSINSSGGSSMGLGKQVYDPQPVPPNTEEEEAFNHACKFVPGEK